jgi:hypothetical protein
MPIPNDLSDELRKLLFGDPWGRVFPERPNPPPPTVDGRTHCLRILKRYLSELTFMRAGGTNLDGSAKDPIPLKVDIKNIHIGWPDNEDQLDFPAIVFLHQPGLDIPIGLNSYIEEETRDRFGRGTVVQWISEYQENVIVEVWANKKAELRAILAGLEVALSPTENMYGIRFRVPDYFDQLVCFSPGTRQEFDEQDSARNRRHARLEVEMRYSKVTLVNVSFPLETTTVVNVDADPDYNTPITEEETAPQPPPHEGPCDPCT